MLSIHSALLLLAVLSKPTHAAWCCGWLGDWDENTLWNLRADLCNNVWAHDMNSDGGYEDKVDVYLGNGDSPQYMFEAYDSNNSFGYCWDATQNFIEQCARGGNGVGSWVYGSEAYYFTAADGGYRKRGAGNNGTETPRVEHADPATLPPLPKTSGTLESLRLNSGTYNIEGTVTHVNIGGLPLDGTATLDLAKRDGGLNTTYGMVHNFTHTYSEGIDLSALIAKSVRGAVQQRAQLQAPETTPNYNVSQTAPETHSSDPGTNSTAATAIHSFRKRQECQVWNGQYALLDGGGWFQDWKLSSGCYQCGVVETRAVRTRRHLTPLAGHSPWASISG